MFENNQNNFIILLNVYTRRLSVWFFFFLLDQMWRLLLLVLTTYYHKVRENIHLFEVVEHFRLQHVKQMTAQVQLLRNASRVTRNPSTGELTQDGVVYLKAYFFWRPSVVHAKNLIVEKSYRLSRSFYSFSFFVHTLLNIKIVY